jgi:RNA polymerase sigma-70 factor (ECF subfamily)
MMEPSDEVLVQRCLAGEGAAFDVLVRRYQKRVFHLTYRLTQHPEDANDLAQEVFVRAYERLHTFRPGAPFWPWLRRVAVNWCLNWLDRQHPAPLSLETGASGEDEEAGIDLPAAGEDPARQAETQALQAEVQRAMATLPPKYRVAVVLRYAEGLSYEEIAQALRLPLGTVKTHLFRARALLQQRLAEVYRDYFGER